MVPAEAILTADIPVTPSASNITDIIIGMGIKGTITNRSIMGTVTDTSHHLDTITEISLTDTTSHRGDIIDIIIMGWHIMGPNSTCTGTGLDFDNR